jgi:glycosyltransferase involved in cell wall biosynthesis
MATFHSKDKSLSGKFYSMIERILAKKTDFLIFVSPALKNIFEAKNIRPSMSSLVIRSRVDIEKFADRRELRKQDHRNVTARLGLPESSKIILFVGLLEPRKRPEFILNELASIVAEDRSIFLIFLGDGELRPYLERRAIELKISSKVRFLGSKSDVEIWVSGSDAVVLASVFEGFPQIALQSAAAGTPIVATNLEEYLGSTIFRIISSKESIADEIVKIINCSKSRVTTKNLELDEWNTKTIDGEHKILLELVADCVRRRK